MYAQMRWAQYRDCCDREMLDQYGQPIRRSRQAASDENDPGRTRIHISYVLAKS